MYTIYINDVPLLISTREEEQALDYNPIDFKVHRYDRGRQGLFNYIDAFEKNNEREGVILLVDDVDQTFSEFRSIYKVIKAAGGLVFNDDLSLLAIFRRGHWDLPKGKIEKGETKKEAAVREVQEETGIQQVELIEKIGKTYHTYSTKKHKRALKISHWYEMRTGDMEVTPQVEEDIEKVEWVDLNQFIDYRPIYKNILDITQKYIDSKVDNDVPLTAIE